MNRLHRSAGLVRLVALLLLAPACAEAAPRVLAEGPGGVTFEVTPGTPSLAAVPGLPDVARLTLAGWSSGSRVGEPDLPAQSFLVGVPEGATVEVAASAADVVSFPGVRLVPVLPATDDDSDPLMTERALQVELLRTAPAYARVDDVPWARVTRITGMRDQRVAIVEVRPARYEPSSGRLEVATRIVVDVRFAGTTRATRPPAGDAAFERVYESVLVNPSSARAFRRAPSDAAARTTSGLGFDVAARWLRLEVSGKGIHEVGGDELAQAGLVTLPVSSDALRLFVRPGVPLLNEDVIADAGGLAEVALRIEDGGDGSFDASDRLVFFGLGTSGWQDDHVGPGAPDDWLDHPYESANPYWLALDAALATPPRRWAARDATPNRPGATPLSAGPARLHMEANLRYARELDEPGLAWDPWTWKSLTTFGEPVDLQVDAIGAVVEAPARLRARLWGRRSPGYFEAAHRLDARFNDRLLAPTPGWWRDQRHDIDTTDTWIADGPNRLTLRLDPPAPPASPGDQAWLSWWELRYARRFVAVADTLEFADDGTAGGDAERTLAPFSDPTPGRFLLLDVSDPLAPVELTAWTATDSPGGHAVTFHDERRPAHYFAATATARKRPGIEPADVRDVRSVSATYLILTSDALEGEAQRLAAHRRAHAPWPNTTVAVVRVSDVMAWYAGGRMDPVAIRNWLHALRGAMRVGLGPSVVCFFGDATFDFHGRYPVGEPGLGHTQVPTFPHNRWVEIFSSDDWLLDVDAGDPGRPVPDFISGRLPAANAGEAAVLIDKIVAYETAPERAAWRNRALFLVDDTMQGNQPDPLGSEHIAQASALERDHLPAWVDRTKVHLVEYPFTSGTVKDGARQAVLSELARGAAWWHFIGHGNPFKLADENAFLLSDVSGLANGSRLPVFFAATCDAGPFDDAIFVPLAEALVERPGGGAIAAISGTVVTYAYANFQLSLALYDALFSTPEAGTTSLGEAVYVAKQRDHASTNDQAYHLLGDPGLCLGLPRHDVRMSAFDDLTGDALGDSLPRGRRVRLEGTLAAARTAEASPLDAASGVARLRVSDAPPLRIVPGTYDSAEYDGNPRALFTGDVPVVNGRFTARFVVPLEASGGAGARVSTYAHGAFGEASGAWIGRLVEGAPTELDGHGPEIQVRFPGGGNLAVPGDEVVIDLHDESGIRTLELSPLDPILVAVDDGDPVDLTASFVADGGTGTRGSVRFTLPADLADGPHQLVVTASDNLAAEGTREAHRTGTSAVFRSAAALAVAGPRAWTLPNPFVATAGMELVFTGGAATSRAAVRVHDVRGRLVRRLSGTGEGGRVVLRWDGRDDAGRALPAGVYLYRAEVTPEDGAARGFDGRLVLLR